MYTIFAYFDKVKRGYWTFEDFAMLYDEGIPFQHFKSNNLDSNSIMITEGNEGSSSINIPEKPMKTE